MCAKHLTHKTQHARNHAVMQSIRLKSNVKKR